MAAVSAFIAVILFVLAAFGVGAGWSVHIVELGLAFLALAVLIFVIPARLWTRNAPPQ